MMDFEEIKTRCTANSISLKPAEIEFLLAKIERLKKIEELAKQLVFQLGESE